MISIRASVDRKAHLHPAVAVIHSVIPPYMSLFVSSDDAFTQPEIRMRVFNRGGLDIQTFENGRSRVNTLDIQLARAANDVVVKTQSDNNSIAVLYGPRK